MSQDTKICPYCAETIKKDAIVCRYCRRDLQGVSATNRWRRRVLGSTSCSVFVVFSICIIVAIAIALNDDPSADENARRPVPTNTVRTGLSNIRATSAPNPAATKSPSPTEKPTSTKTPTSTPTLTPAPAGEGRVVTNSNMRSGPSTEYDVVGVIAAGETISIYARSETDWFLLNPASSIWIASSLVELAGPYEEIPVTDELPPTPTLTPTLTPSPSPNKTYTARAEHSVASATARRAAVIGQTATIEAYVNSPPVGTWCDQNGERQVCVYDFRYVLRAGYTNASANSRFIAFGISVYNGSFSDILVSPIDVSLVMSNGSTFDYASETYSYWSHPLSTLTVASGDHTYGGILFYVPRDKAPRRVIYRGGWFENDIEIDLYRRPDKTD